jgi:hypothetical protein
MSEFSLNARHRKLANRVRCCTTWTPKETDMAGHEHTCEVFQGHTGPHRCRCGGGWQPFQRRPRPRMGRAS